MPANNKNLAKERNDTSRDSREIMRRHRVEAGKLAPTAWLHFSGSSADPRLLLRGRAAVEADGDSGALLNF